MHIEGCKKFSKVSINANPKINIIGLEGGFGSVAPAAAHLLPKFASFLRPHKNT